MTAAHETCAAIREGSSDQLIHYVADTGPLVATRGPSVVTIHGVASRWASGIRNSRQEWVWRKRVERAARSTDLVITVSKSSANDIASVFEIDPHRIRTIPHGIDFEKFSAAISLSAEVQARVPERFILYVGNIEPRKNVSELVRAMSEKTVKALGIPLVIAGKPAWNYAESMQLIEQADNVIYLGFVSDQDRTALMQSASLFVFPSRYEGFGFPVLEALATGTRVLTSTRGALAEVAGPSTILESLTPESIAAGIVRVLTGGGQTPAEIQIRKDWARSFDWSTSVEAHIEAYREVLAQ
ncbi:glycosyltransferase family 4 protein [Rhodococcus sp. SGAir0479]|uniref:glycosyltransferase family 4 protein n=1 Tax=Rhodococcus sp. SGAir0479 TaxID=2567884 RepID=UPI0034A0C6B8